MIGEHPSIYRVIGCLISSGGKKENVAREAESGDAVERGSTSRSRRRARHLAEEELEGEEEDEGRNLEGSQEEGPTNLRTCLKKDSMSPLNAQSVEEAGTVSSFVACCSNM